MMVTEIDGKFFGLVCLESSIEKQTNIQKHEGQRLIYSVGRDFGDPKHRIYRVRAPKAAGSHRSERLVVDSKLHLTSCLMPMIFT